MTSPQIRAVADAFDRAADSGRSVAFWWRDDDAVAASPALDRLLAIRARYDAPISFAVIPDRLQTSLVDRLGDEADICILPHGYAHENHAPKGEKAAEFGPHRPLGTMLVEIEAGWTVVRSHFGAQALGVFVPPWNRIAPDLRGALADIDLVGCSTFGGIEPGRDLNAHLDPVDWRGGRSLASSDAIAAMLMRALSDGRSRVGYLTHHLMFDEALWAFTDDLLAIAASHSAVRLQTLSGFVRSDGSPRRGRHETVSTRRQSDLADCLP